MREIRDEVNLWITVFVQKLIAPDIQLILDNPPVGGGMG